MMTDRINEAEAAVTAAIERDGVLRGSVCSSFTQGNTRKETRALDAGRYVPDDAHLEICLRCDKKDCTGNCKKNGRTDAEKGAAMKETIQRAIETYGAEAQLVVAVEELSELIKELCKYKRYADNTGAILEELADCYVVMEEIKMIFGFSENDVERIEKRKLARLEKRMNERSKA